MLLVATRARVDTAAFEAVKGRLNICRRQAEYLSEAGGTSVGGKAEYLSEEGGISVGRKAEYLSEGRRNICRRKAEYLSG
jgi:hypothetical protein